MPQGTGYTLVSPMRRVETDSVPILPLRNSVVFPASVVPVNVGRLRSVRLIEDLIGKDRAMVGILSQRDASVDEPDFADLFEIGTLGRVVKVIRLGAENYSVVLHGFARFRVNGHGVRRAVHAGPDRPHRGGSRARRRARRPRREPARVDAQGARASRRTCRRRPPALDNVRESGTLADLIASNLTLDQASVADKQRILETLDPKARVRAVAAIVHRQIEVLRVKREISVMVADEGKNQREQVLRQQMKDIKEELGEGAEDDEVEELREKIRSAQLSEEAQKVAKKQLGRLCGDAAAVGRVQRHAHVPRVDCRPPVVARRPTDKLDIGDVRRASTRTTTASRR